MFESYPKPTRLALRGVQATGTSLPSANNKSICLSTSATSLYGIRYGARLTSLKASIRVILCLMSLQIDGGDSDGGE